jgi:hypothetical protein
MVSIFVSLFKIWNLISKQKNPDVENGCCAKGKHYYKPVFYPSKGWGQQSCEWKRTWYMQSQWLKSIDLWKISLIVKNCALKGNKKMNWSKPWTKNILKFSQPYFQKGQLQMGKGFYKAHDLKTNCSLSPGNVFSISCIVIVPFHEFSSCFFCFISIKDVTWTNA